MCLEPGVYRCVYCSACLDSALDLLNHTRDAHALSLAAPLPFYPAAPPPPFLYPGAPLQHPLKSRLLGTTATALQADISCLSSLYPEVNYYRFIYSVL